VRKGGRLLERKLVVGFLRWRRIFERRFQRRRKQQRREQRKQQRRQ
jgi:hypothetical protein